MTDENSKKLKQNLRKNIDEQRFCIGFLERVKYDAKYAQGISSVSGFQRAKLTKLAQSRIIENTKKKLKTIDEMRKNGDEHLIEY